MSTSIEIGWRYPNSQWNVTGTANITPQQPAPTSTPTPTPTPSPNPNLYDDFNTKTPYRLTDGQVSPNGKWRCLFAGGGAAEIKSESTNDQFLYLAPAAVGYDAGTRGANLATTKMYKDFDLTLDVKTIQQLRKGLVDANGKPILDQSGRQKNLPNNWEVAWINWTRSGSLTDITENRFHAYAFTLKMQGYQLEKKDNEAQDDTAEIYLTTGGGPPSVKLNTWQKHRIRVRGTDTGKPLIEVWIDDVPIITYSDNRVPLNSEKMKREGPIVLYTEDAAVGFDNVFITPL
jgi:Domain of Unknown Function (DUF1080)